MDDLVQSAVKEARAILGDKKNKSALAIAGATYFLSKDNKERNAIMAGIAALILLPDTEDEEDD